MSAEAALVFFFFFFRDTITIKTLFAGVGEERIALQFFYIFLLPSLAPVYRYRF